MTAIERVELEPAFVLHGRVYRETSELLDTITRSHGRVSLVARGMRRPRSGLRGILQPFQPLLVSWSGRGSSLMTLRAAEAVGIGITLQGTAMMSAFYVNELVLRFLHKGDPHPHLFAAYEETLQRLGLGDSPEVVLRRFEMELLAEAGYGLNLQHDAETGEPLNPAACYEFVVERGPVAIDTPPQDVATYSGAELLAIAHGHFDDGRHLASARRLLRGVLDHYLDGKPLRTREVFAAMRR